MKHFRPPSRRSLVETTLAIAAGFFAVLAAIWPDWIEAFGVDPDGGNGSVEWAIPIVLATVALVLGFVARRRKEISACSIGGPSPAATSSAPSSLRSRPAAWDS